MAPLVDCSSCSPAPSRVHPMAAVEPQQCLPTSSEAPAPGAGQAADALPVATATRVRAPAEPPVLIEYVREREVESLVEAGKVAAEYAILRAGFLGGESKRVLFFWILFGVLFGFIAVGWLVGAHAKNLEFAPSGRCCPSVLESGAYLLYYAALCTGFLQRAYYLIAQRPVEALVALGVGASRAAIIMIINLLAFNAHSLGTRCEGQRFIRLKPLFFANFITAVLHIWYVGDLMQSKQTRRASAQFYWLRVHLVEYFFAMGLGSILIQKDYAGGVGFSFVAVVIMAVHASFARTFNQKAAETNAIVQMDVVKYTQVWASLSKLSGPAEASNREIWNAIRAELSDLMAGAEREAPNYNLVKKVRADVEEFRVEKRSSKPRQLVGDLGVLFAQAARLQENFQSAADDVASEADVLVHHSHVKRRKRAIEKLFRSYDGDASRLTDLVRCSITCKDSEALLRCLRAIRADDRFVVVFFKDRFRESYDVRESLGYRNIALSVCIVDAFSMTHNVEHHVCELQLGLQSFEDLRNEHGHARYVKWRDQRAA